MRVRTQVLDSRLLLIHKTPDVSIPTMKAPFYHNFIHHPCSTNKIPLSLHPNWLVSRIATTWITVRGDQNHEDVQYIPETDVKEASESK